MDNIVKYKSIVILADAGIGDFVWATSALQLIRDCDKNVEIILVVSDSVLPLVDKKFLGIDKLIVTKYKYYASLNKFKRLFYKLFWCIKNYPKIHGVEACIMLDSSLFFAFAAKNVYGIKNIIGADKFAFGNNVLNKDLKYYTKIVEMPVDTDRTSFAIRYQIIIRSVFPSCNLVLPKLPDTSFLSEKVINLIGITKKYKIALCAMGAVGSRCWNTDYFKSLIKLISNLTGEVSFFIIGNGLAEYSNAENIIESFPDLDIRNLCRKTSLSELSEFFKNIDLLVSVDTGVIHIASVYKIPVISFHGQTLPENSMPLNHKAVTLCSYRECSPCTGKRILYGYDCADQKCMSDITPEKVIIKIKGILNLL